PTVGASDAAVKHQQLALKRVDIPPEPDSLRSAIPVTRNGSNNSESNKHRVRGFVATPSEIIDDMVGRLFRGRAPKQTDTLLDPGCGTGAFLTGIRRWCQKHDVPVPQMTGIESAPEH